MTLALSWPLVMRGPLPSFANTLQNVMTFKDMSSKAYLKLIIETAIEIKKIILNF